MTYWDFSPERRSYYLASVITKGYWRFSYEQVSQLALDIE
jgi:hypothetical protein